MVQLVVTFRGMGKLMTIGEGLMKLTLPGSLVNPVRMNARIKSVLLEVIGEDMERTVLLSDTEFVRVMPVLYWLNAKLTGATGMKQRLTKNMARTLHFWVQDHKNHHLSGLPSFQSGMQWITNQWNKKWSVFQILEEQR